MLVFRIAQARHSASALDGFGAAMYPGRWNSRGVHLVYTASSQALALLEMLVHVNLVDVPAGQRLLVYEVPDDAVAELAREHWPRGWDRLPYSDAVRQVGDSFIREGTHLAMRAPSALAPREHNVLINPAHPRLGQIVQVADEPLAPDPRLFGRKTAP